MPPSTIMSERTTLTGVSLPSACVIHVGDIHHPVAATERLLDLKDVAFPEHVATAVATDPLQTTIRYLINTINSAKPDAVLISGDLTEKGDLEAYRRCVGYLNRSLEINTQPGRFHVVPGNHDVHRELVNDSNIYDKFAPLSLAWKEISGAVLTCGTPRTESVRPSNSQILICSMNSCIGCGERRYLPSASRDFAPAVFEQIDTPAFDSDHIVAVEQAIARTSQNVLPIILAHHNLLSQRIPRVAPYAEVLNSGHARGLFSSRGRPVVYCHGHTHDEPIEVIDQFLPGQGRLISISAPELKDGFNKLNVCFGSDGMPLGLTIARFRRQDATVNLQREVRIRLRMSNGPMELSNDCTVAARVAPAQPVSFADFHKMMTSELGRNLRKRTTTRILEELEWLGVLAIMDREYGQRAWFIRKNTP